MLTEYLHEILEDRSFYAEIPNYPGVLTNANTLEEGREMLQDDLEGEQF